MENELQNNYLPSLKEIGLLHVAILLCSNVEILNLFQNFRFKSGNDDSKMKEWNVLVNIVKEQALKLELPGSLIKELNPLLKPIGAEIFKWRNFIENFFYFRQDLIKYMDVLNWTVQGTIDYRKTAENIVKYKSLDVRTRYELSCLFCLEEEIKCIWENLTDQEKILCTKRDIINHLHTGVLSFWAYTLNGNIDGSLDCLVLANIQACTVYQYAFENAATTGNLVATRYFFPKLTYEERGESLTRTADEVAQKMCFDITTEVDGVPKEIYSDILSYLLAQMTKEEQSDIFQKHPFEVLHCYIDWPRQRLFPKLLKHMWPFLDVDNYHYLICFISKNFNLSAFNYSKLFKEFYCDSPYSYRQSILEQQCLYGTFLSFLFDTNDIENIKLVLRSLETAFKQQIFFCNSGFRIIHKILLENKWCLLQMFMQECELSGKNRVDIKPKFQLFLTKIYTKQQINSKRYKWTKFYHMLSQTRIYKCTYHKSQADCPVFKKFPTELRWW